MPSLSEIQRAFLPALTGGDLPDDLLAMIAGDRRMAAERIEIHRNNVTISLREALRAVFPVTDRLLGQACFDALAQGFLRASLPQSPCLLDFGGGLPAFIDGSTLSRSLPYLSDVARLEWAWHQTYHAADARPLDAAVLSDLPAQALPRVRLRSHPSRHVVASRYPVERIWSAHQEADVPAVDLRLGCARLLLLRPGSDVSIIALDQAAFVFALALDAGQPLSAAAAAALQANAAFDITRTLADLLKAGAFCDFDLTTEDHES